MTYLYFGTLLIMFLISALVWIRKGIFLAVSVKYDWPPRDAGKLIKAIHHLTARAKLWEATEDCHSTWSGNFAQRKLKANAALAGVFRVSFLFVCLFVLFFLTRYLDKYYVHNADIIKKKKKKKKKKKIEKKTRRRNRLPRHVETSIARAAVQCRPTCPQEKNRRLCWVI